jgi:signal transduction histidine kinase
VAFHGIKTGIAVNIAILLTVATLLADIVMIITTRKDLIQSEISKGYLIFSEIEKHLVKEKNGRTYLQLEYAERLKEYINTAGLSCAVVQDANSGLIFSGGSDCLLFDELKMLTDQSVAFSKRTVNFRGTTWGVLWMQDRYLVLTSPLDINGGTGVGAGLLISLENIYKTMRRSQEVLFPYLVINLIMLTAAGVYSISNIAVKPVQRMAKRAEEFREEDELFFLHGGRENEFDKLSKALNRLLKRISEDREKLQEGIRSLEKVNMELKRAEKDVVRAEKMASVGRLSSGIAHEIGNPIGIVQGYLDLLKQNDVSNEKKKEYLRRAGDEINRIDAIIRQLLDFSRPSEEKIGITGVHEIIRDTAEMVRHQPFMAGIETILLLEAKNDKVLCDPGQLRQVFLNLFINAADAMSLSGKGKGSLIIKSEEVEGIGFGALNGRSAVRITFTDDGPGISEENIGNIFDPFFTTKEPGKGTGLGLYVCFTLIEGMGGKIAAKSRINEGTAMIMLLPLNKIGDK